MEGSQDLIDYLLSVQTDNTNNVAVLNQTITSINQAIVNFNNNIDQLNQQLIDCNNQIDHLNAANVMIDEIITFIPPDQK